MNDRDEKNLANCSAVGEEILGVNSEIARKLRQFYVEIQEEALPVRLLELLERLDQAEKISLNSMKKV
ncbi:NepR family anti-sigma factor [Bartonella sp. CB178]|uniref:NepR family anti-sigma factor n=1 Tax=Bartonella sp. CB178 TaxID=3112255 RepID=UPI00300DD5D0